MQRKTTRIQVIEANKTSLHVSHIIDIADAITQKRESPRDSLKLHLQSKLAFYCSPTHVRCDLNVKGKAEREKKVHFWR